MPAIPTYLTPKPGLFLALAGTALFACTCRAQEGEKKPEEASKVASVEVTPALTLPPLSRTEKSPSSSRAKSRSAR